MGKRAGRPRSQATPRPVLGVVHESRIDRGLLHVAHGSREVNFIPNLTVEIVHHPDWASPLQESIRLLGRERLPRLHDTTRRESRQRLVQHMHGVGTACTCSAASGSVGTSWLTGSSHGCCPTAGPAPRRLAARPPPRRPRRRPPPCSDSNRRLPRTPAVLLPGACRACSQLQRDDTHSIRRMSTVWEVAPGPCSCRGRGCGDGKCGHVRHEPKRHRTWFGRVERRFDPAERFFLPRRTRPGSLPRIAERHEPWSSRQDHSKLVAKRPERVRSM